MTADRRFFVAALRGSAVVAVVAAGLVALVGSGGGSEAPECSFFSSVCNPDVTPIALPSASVFPSRLAVQAGASAVFTAQSSGIDQPAYQWRRSIDGGVNWVDVPGATAASYTLAPAQQPDHGAVFRVDVRSGGSSTVQASSNGGTLLVSSRPAVAFADAEFDPADWGSSAIATPSLNGPSHQEERRASGGQAGAYRHMVHTMTAGPSSLRVFNIKTSALYDPQALGAVQAIDYTEDCARHSASSSALVVTSYLVFEQDGRRFVSSRSRSCLGLWLANASPLPSLQASDFVQVDGPACAGGQACPDFSANGAALRFGFERRVNLPAGEAAGLIEHGIDNWKVNVWRP